MFINCTRRNINAISVFITFVIFLIMDLVCINFLNSTSVNNNKLESNGQNTILIDSVKIDNIKNYTLQNGETIWSLKIPKINLKALIAEGTEDDVLCNYIGHFSNTGIINGNVGLAAHNRGYEKNYFKDIKKLELNDEIIYNYKNIEKVYKVSKIEEINSDDWSLLDVSRENKITLITCIENEPKKRLCVQGIEINNGGI